MTIQLIEHNLHEIAVEGRRVLFHIPTSALFELDPVGEAVIDALRGHQTLESDYLNSVLAKHFDTNQVSDTLDEFRQLNIIIGGPETTARAPAEITGEGLTTLVLNVNTGCNLSCTYCYKEDLTTPAKGDLMDIGTAQRSVDMLIKQAGPGARVNLVFLGGEPLTNMKLIRSTVAYAEEQAIVADVKVDFTLTTNATLLTNEIIDYLDSHRFGLTVSMDGPKALHDRNRKTIGGKGTYDVVAKNVRRLLSRYRSRPVGARVTLTPGVTDVHAIHDHLVGDLGFHEVGFSPATAGDNDIFNLNGQELADVFAGMKALGRLYMEGALRGLNIGFSNMHQLMTDLHEGTRKLIPCGAGVGMLAVDKDGKFNLCHRFTGSELPTFGDVDSGLDKAALSKFVNDAQDRTNTDCATCRIRNLCSGGCYHESYARYGDPLHPTYHYCDLMRDWVDFGLEVYTRITTEKPEFFAHHIEPRRAT
ncbi:MAG TPA: quinohemoprotein amine dehydrogenase maturation protein [Sneathiellales bacterium]|nr:quinohemoprotein amine dehydrogenase maturation protein [Sneathiellales bacterium]